MTLSTADRSESISLRRKLRERGIDRVLLLVVPAALLVVGLFVNPFLYGLLLSFHPQTGGGWFDNYVRFFRDPFLLRTLPTTISIALPVTLTNLVIAVPVALKVRRLKRSRLLSVVLILPIALGTVLVADGLLTYLGPQGWLNRVLLGLHLISEPLRLTHNYWGVFVAMLISGFPFTFMMTLSYASGINPALESAAATLGAGPLQRFAHILLPLLVPGLAITFCLSFVEAFSVFPTAVLVGSPAGATRVIAIAAYQAAFEQYDFPMASSIAMIMAACQLLVFLVLLAFRSLFYRGSSDGAKG
jgi:putative spermidine/putrescine transport system permease protein